MKEERRAPATVGQNRPNHPRCPSLTVQTTLAAGLSKAVEQSNFKEARIWPIDYLATEAGDSEH